MEEVAAKLEATALQPGQHITSCIWLCYLGEDMCANCALGLEHGAKTHSTTLGYHRDRGDSSNSQCAAANLTLNVGATRYLSMQLRVEHPGYSTLVPALDCEPFPMSSGTVFRLHPGDELRLPREMEGEVYTGAFFHGMQYELPAGQISCGFVFRVVDHARDVDIESHCVIPTQSELCSLREGRRDVQFAEAQRRWNEQAHAYTECVRERVCKALHDWSLTETLGQCLECD